MLKNSTLLLIQEQNAYGNIGIVKNKMGQRILTFKCMGFFFLI